MATSRDFNEFSRRIDARGDEVVATIEIIMRKVSLVALTKVSESTPVDTGRARANWLVSISRMIPNRGVVSPVMSGTRGTEARGNANSAAAIEKGARLLQRFRFSGLGRSASIFITNSLSYIGFLNAGSSKQAPANFVRKAVRTAVRPIRTVRIFREV